jgi:Tfp pilus assembly protein PilN
MLGINHKKWLWWNVERRIRETPIVVVMMGIILLCALLIFLIMR